MENLWRHFRKMPWQLQVPIVVLAALVALVILGPRCATSDDGPDSASDASTTVGSLPVGDDTSVTRVTDGDSLEVTGGTRVRLTGIDAPEADSHECYSSEAAAQVRDLIGPGTKIRLVYDADRLDGYGRTLAYVYRVSDGLFVNLSLARDGFVRQLTVRPNTSHAEDIGRAVADAQNAERGLWAAC